MNLPIDLGENRGVQWGTATRVRCIPPPAEQLDDDDEPKTACVRRVSRRRGRRPSAACFLWASPCTFTVAGAITPERSWWGLLAIPAAWFAATYLSHSRGSGYVWRTRRRLEARRWNLCGSCGYDTTAPASTCPECGSEFNTERLRGFPAAPASRRKRMRMIPRFAAKVR